MNRNVIFKSIPCCGPIRHAKIQKYIHNQIPKVHVVSKIKIEKTLNVKIVNNGFCKEFVSLKFTFDTFFNINE